MITLTFWLASCNNISEFNVDPNNSATARPQEVLTSALGYIAFVMDAQYNDNAFLWGQYWTWGTGVSLGDDARYIQLANAGNQAWARSYSDALADIKFLKKVMIIMDIMVLQRHLRFLFTSISLTILVMFLILRQ